MYYKSRPTWRRHEQFAIDYAAHKHDPRVVAAMKQPNLRFRALRTLLNTIAPPAPDTSAQSPGAGDAKRPRRRASSMRSRHGDVLQSSSASAAAAASGVGTVAAKASTDTSEDANPRPAKQPRVGDKDTVSVSSAPAVGSVVAPSVATPSDYEPSVEASTTAAEQALLKLPAKQRGSYVGITKTRVGNFEAYLWHKSRKYYFGRFETARQAALVYVAGRRALVCLRTCPRCFSVT